MSFLPLENSDHVLCQFPLSFRQTKNWDALFHCIVYVYSFADWNGLCDHLRDVP